MRKRSTNIIVLFFVLLFVFSLFGYNAFADKAFEKAIDAKLNSIVYTKDPKVISSSNPYDYIKGPDSSKDYNYIVSQGEKSLNYLLKKFATSNSNGLKEYIMAIACSEILKENPDSKNWGSGKEWYINYLKQKK